MSFEQLNTEAENPERFTVVGNRAFFVAETAEHGAELWVTDGSFPGTYMVKDIRPGEDESHIAPLAALGERLLFVASDLTTFGGLWISDGTEAGTQLVRDTSTGSENIRLVNASDERVYFESNHQDYGRELWVTDGTTAGTYMIADINPDGDSTVENAETALVWNGKLYFWSWFYQPNTFTAYPQLYVTDGSQGNLTQLTQNTYSGSVLLDYDMIVFNDRLYFTWRSQEDGEELWSTDGTPAGTQLAVDIAPLMSNGHGYGGLPHGFQVWNDKLLFFAYEKGWGTYQSLFSSDGTQGNTELIGLVDAGLSVDDMIPLGDDLIFAGRLHDGTPYNLWATDGTAAGTRLVSDAVTPAGFHSALGSRFVVFDNRLLFLGEDEAHGIEPWISDGTTAGTMLLKDVNPGSGDSPSPTIGGGRFTLRDNKVYFVAAVAEEDYQLMETDGSPAGTIVVAPASATVTSNPMGFDGFWNTIGLPAPYLIGDILVFPGNYHDDGVFLYRK